MSILGLLLRVPSIAQDVPIINISAPSITTTAIIGTEIAGSDGTWEGTSPKFNYQWQRNTGSWVDITGATSKNYTPVDADFGYALRVKVNARNEANNIDSYSNETSITAELPTQTLGANIISNSDLDNWTAGVPDGGFSIQNTAANATITQTAPDGTAGTGGAHLNNHTSAVFVNIRTPAVHTIGQMYQLEYALSQWSGGRTDVGWGDSGENAAIDSSSVRATQSMSRAYGTYWRAQPGGSLPRDWTYDYFRSYPITINNELTAPSANMRITQYYTLPTSPIAGQTLQLMLRISNYSVGNYLMALVDYTGSTWRIALYSFASLLRTTQVSAVTIGSHNGVRANLNGDSITIETTDNGGSSWTSRLTKTLSLYNTARGVNVAANSPFTLGNMYYEPAV